MATSYASVGTLITPERAVRESTMLELHLNRLVQLRDNLNLALERSRRCADRLLGAEPAQSAKADASSPADPPLCYKLETAGDDLGQLVDLLLQQIARLERL